MAVITRGFTGTRDRTVPRLPPGQHLARDFPVLSAGPTPLIPKETWQLELLSEFGEPLRSWSWQDLMRLPSEDVVADIHCVTRWSKLATRWTGVSLDTLLADVDTAATHVMAHSYGGYTTNLGLEDISYGKAWVVFRYDGADLAAEHGGPARLLVPHLYLWKSAKWLQRLVLLSADQPGFWEGLGYHNHADPQLEQRHRGD